MSHGSRRRQAAISFVGRAYELAHLRAAWDSASQGSARLVAIEGDSGVGKTALVDELLKAEPRLAPTATAIRVNGLEAEPRPPWGVFEDIVGRIPGVSQADWLATLDAQASTMLVGQRLAAQIQAADQPMVIIVDDAQWADGLSMEALQYALRRLRTDPVLLILGFRGEAGNLFSGEDAGGAGLPKAWRQLLEGDQGSRLVLDGLPPEQLLLLAVANGHAGLSPEGAARLYQSTDGNPDHVLALLSLLPDHPIVTETGPLPAPRGQALAITSRLATCDRLTRELVAAAAVLGLRFSVAALRVVTGLPTPGDQICEAIDGGFLTEVAGTGGRELAFTQVLTREAIYRDLSNRVRADLHRRCARLGGPDALQHRIDAADGVDDQLAADLTAAAMSKLAVHDIPSASFYLQRALDSTTPGPARRALLLTAVEALLVAGKAIAAREYEAELAQATSDPWRDYVAGYQALLAGRVDESIALQRGALAALDAGEPAPDGAPPDLKARVATQLALIGIVTLSYVEMVTYGNAAVEAGSDEPWVSGFAWLAKTVGMALAGDGPEALALLGDAGEPGATSGLDGLAARGIIRLWTDDLAGAAQDLHMLVNRATRGEALRPSQAIGFLGEVEYRRGRLSEAALFADLAVGNAVDNDRFWDYPLLHALACYPHAARAEWPEAEYHVAESDKWAQMVGTATGLAFAAAAKAAIAQAHGDAERLLVAAGQIEANYDSKEPGTHLFGPVRADALAQLGRLDEAEEALAEYLAGPGQVGRRSAQMSAARVAGQIALARGQHDVAISECARARDLAEAVGLPLEVGRIDLLTAECLSGAGRRVAAERALAAARRLFIAIGANACLQLADGRAVRWGITVADTPDPFATLTRREHDIALLVCESLTNVEIAERLFLSRKTVETHLSHMYDKLAVTRRADVIALFNQFRPA
jgi:DNA-binding CsgD family transcriptional regulator